jgi:putative hydrolase of the HAD superfamily
MRNRRQVIFLDLYGTMVHEATGQVSVSDFLTREGVFLPESHTMPFWAELGVLAYSELSSSQRAYETAVRRHRIDLLVTHGVSPESASVVVDHFEEWERNLSLVPYPEVLSTLERLGELGVRRIVASNWHWDIRRVLAESGIAQLLDGVTGSAQVGYRKPQAGFYQAALEIAGFPPAECLFVGDNWHDDVEHPLREGMAAVHLHRQADAIHFVFPRGPELTTIPRIATLEEVVTLV